jgi:hypothetical protein
MNTETILEVFMKDEFSQQRILAVQRFLIGEKPESICASLGRSKAWLYKWVERYLEDDDSWSKDRSRRPLNVINRTPKEIEEIVKLVRLNLYNRDLFSGAQAILWELEDLDVKPLPSPRTINRILSRNALTHRRTGKYEAKGTPYPRLPSLSPNQTHQADLVGPCYLKGPVRFYGLNVIDTATVRLVTHQGRPGHPGRFLDHLEAHGNPGQYPGGQCHVLLWQSDASPRHGASYPTLPAQWSRALVHPHGGTMEKRHDRAVQ